MNADTIVKKWYLVDFTQDEERLEIGCCGALSLRTKKGGGCRAIGVAQALFLKS